MEQYALGLDFGTLSARAVLVSVENGAVKASASWDYAHGVMDQQLPCGRNLSRGWALQDPRDYMEALEQIVPQALKSAGIAGDQVAAIGVDFTCSSTLPCLADGTPLCTLERYTREPNAYVKLWKHHAEEQAAQILAVARSMQLPWLGQSSGRVSAEWVLPKMLQVKQEAPDLWQETSVYLEAGDWMVWQLGGRLVRSESFAAWKNFWMDGSYPSDDFYAAVDPELADITRTRLRGDVLPMHQCAGYLTEAMAFRLGLKAGVPVAPGMTDAHTGVMAAGLSQCGDVLAALGTSACYLLQEKVHIHLSGTAGQVPDGILPGLISYEANQSMGEVLAWYVDNACPAKIAREAEERGLSLHQLLTEKAALLPPGGNGLLALDWFNGNRCILGDSRLTGLILGLTLQTPPESVYRALMEASVFGMRAIMDNFEQQGLTIRRIVALGGIARKNPLLMQITADILGKEIAVSSAREGAAQGTAIMAAAAAGLYASIDEAIQAMGQPVEAVYHPGANRDAYESLYGLYRKLHDGFGRDHADLMHALGTLARP